MDPLLGGFDVDEDEEEEDNLCRILDLFTIIGGWVPFMFLMCLTIALPHPWRTRAVADGTSDDNMMMKTTDRLLMCRSDQNQAETTLASCERAFGVTTQIHRMDNGILVGGWMADGLANDARALV